MTLILAFVIPAATGSLLVNLQASATKKRPQLIGWVPILLFFVVAIPSTLQFLFPSILHALRRDGHRILHEGQVWRLLTSLTVQDGGVGGTIFNLACLIGFAVLATALLGERRLLLLFFVGGVAGELVGLSWQPIGAGNSVGNLGIAGGILALALVRGPNTVARLLAIAGVAAGLLLLLQRNIHGAALIAGIAAGILLQLTPPKTSTAA